MANETQQSAKRKFLDDPQKDCEDIGEVTQGLGVLVIVPTMFLGLVAIIIVALMVGGGGVQFFRSLLAGVIFIPMSIAGLVTISSLRASIISRANKLEEILINCVTAVFCFLGTAVLFFLFLWIGGEKFRDFLSQLREAVAKAF